MRSRFTPSFRTRKSRMRDLDQLQEQDPEERGRSIGAWLVVATLLLVLSGGLFLVWSRGEKAGTREDDPLDRLAQLGRAQPERKPEPGKSSERRKALDPATLTFERTLTEQEDRPEVVAALAAAAREEERLAKAQAAPAAHDPRELNAQVQRWIESKIAEMVAQSGDRPD